MKNHSIELKFYDVMQIFHKFCCIIQHISYTHHIMEYLAELFFTNVESLGKFKFDLNFK